MEGFEVTAFLGSNAFQVAKGITGPTYEAKLINHRLKLAQC
ncbi:MAG TPA: hypothetical protein VGL56_19140 [Fimbriimonadaceae bacterium]|jgi:hypothetical protein